jgi:GH18 family chitinase
MFRRKWSVWILLLLVGSAWAAEPARVPVVAGYLPSYRAEGFRVEQAAALTDVILFSVEPRADGTIDDSRLPPQMVRPLREKLAAQGCRVLLTIGGWGRSTPFGTVTADEELCGRLVQNLADLCEQRQLDGIDVDWEHPRSDAEREQLGTFLARLRQRLAPRERLVTIAVAPWETLAPATVESVDRIHLMAYDNGGKHSTPDYARESLARLAAAGVPAEKVCLGIPFYGRPYVGKFGKARTYAEICERHDPPLDADIAAGFYFNGPATVAHKVRLARESGLGGVMIWEIGQDATDLERSLLEVIRRESGLRP